MPELPEVETTLRGITPHLQGQKITNVIVRHPKLRWPVPSNLCKLLQHKTIQCTARRGKYLLLTVKGGTLIIHLGMSGRLRILTSPTAAEKHDHIDIVFGQHLILRYTDPRRFGAVLWTDQAPELYPLLKDLGPEPLEKQFSGKLLWQKAQKKSAPIKSFIMDSKVVVGVGNIYANEALFLAKIHPLTPANHLSEKQCSDLAKAIKIILRKAIQQGGTTLKDFVNSAGKPGYFTQYLSVYGRANLPCTACHTKLQSIRLGQRNTVFCPTCQKRL